MENKRNSFLHCLKSQCMLLKNAGKFSTARNYLRTYNSFSSFASETPGLPEWPDESTVLKYNTWLQQRGIVRNSISFYMRILRAAYNKAAGTSPAKHLTPFRSVYTGVDKTRKRAVDENIIICLYKLDLSKSPTLSLTRDLFIFSYCTRGMAFVDMVFLKKSNISNGLITYCRKKTGQQLSVRIENCSRRIIERYIDSQSAYLFPVIHTFDPENAFRQYQTALGYYNRNLKKLGRMTGAGIRLSSYMSRHSWASNARKYNIPLSVISAGMGHDSEKTTMIYLASMDNSTIDIANRKILAPLNRAVPE